MQSADSVCEQIAGIADTIVMGDDDRGYSCYGRFQTEMYELRFAKLAFETYARDYSAEKRIDFYLNEIFRANHGGKFFEYSRVWGPWVMIHSTNPKKANSSMVFFVGPEGLTAFGGGSGSEGIFNAFYTPYQQSGWKAGPKLPALDFDSSLEEVQDFMLFGIMIATRKIPKPNAKYWFDHPAYELVDKSSFQASFAWKTNPCKLADEPPTESHMFSESLCFKKNYDHLSQLSLDQEWKEIADANRIPYAWGRLSGTDCKEFSDLSGLRKLVKRTAIWELDPRDEVPAMVHFMKARKVDLPCELKDFATAMAVAGITHSMLRCFLGKYCRGTIYLVDPEIADHEHLIYRVPSQLDHPCWPEFLEAYIYPLMPRCNRNPTHFCGPVASEFLKNMIRKYPEPQLSGWIVPTEDEETMGERRSSRLFGVNA